MSSLKIQFWSLNSIRLATLVIIQMSIAFPLRLKHTWYIIQFPCTKYKFVNVHFDHGLKYNNTGKYASFREVLSDICFWVLYFSRVMYVYVYLGQFARDSPQCNQFCVNFIIWVHFRTGLFNFINFSPWMSTNKKRIVCGIEWYLWDAPKSAKLH